MDTNEQIAVMTAYTEGKMIQMRRHNSDKWEDVLIENVLWNWCDRDYRVKPECTLPKTWEEFCKNNPIKDDESYIDVDSVINVIDDGEENFRLSKIDMNLLPNKQIAKAMLALCQLLQLRECYNRGWKPDWNDGDEFKFTIEVVANQLHYSKRSNSQFILAFKTIELRDEFLNNFRDLIEIAKPLL